MRVRVVHTIDRLADDYADIPAQAVVGLRKITKDNTERGRDLARTYARAKSGPHGKNYYKRITSEVDDLTGEFGPTGSGTPVGAGYRHGAGNGDLAHAADRMVPQVVRDVDALADRLFR
jgi:hypothetical protein